MLPQVTGDRVQLQQVLLNLIVNAIEAMSAVKDRPRELTIVSAQGTDGVVVEVRDSGIGLDQDRAERVFDAFYTTKAEGLGIGLSISLSMSSRRAVAALGGPGGGGGRLTGGWRRRRCGEIPRDSGIGLDQDRAERVFEAFSTTKAEGIGIGLSISRSIVEAHDGRLWATSNQPSWGGLRVLAPGCRRRDNRARARSSLSSSTTIRPCADRSRVSSGR